MDKVTDPIKRRAKIANWITTAVTLAFLVFLGMVSLGLFISLPLATSKTTLPLGLDVFYYSALFALPIFFMNQFVYLAKRYDLFYYLSILTMVVEIIGLMCVTATIITS